MDEVELLCSRVAILAFGKLKAIGSQQHLKTQYAEGYNLRINYLPKDQIAAKKFVEKFFPDAIIMSEFKGNLSYKIPKSETFQLGHTFEVLESQSHQNGITDWSLQQQGLEEIFELIVKQSHKEMEIESQQREKNFALN